LRNVYVLCAKLLVKVINKYIEIEGNKLAYVVFNSTVIKTMICFHGFGQEAKDYDWFAKAHPEFRLIAIDLFFHGESTLSTSSALTPLGWKSFFDILITNEQINHFSVTGYSMGGRFALTTFSLYPHLTDNIFLVAADGIITSKLFKTATSTALMRRIFKGMINSYPTFIQLSTMLTKLGIINKGLQKFATLHMKNSVERHRIFNSWTSFRELKLSPTAIARISEKHTIPVYIRLGTYDRVIPVSRIKPKLIKNKWLDYKTLEITHHKLFYYDFLNQ